MSIDFRRTCGFLTAIALVIGACVDNVSRPSEQPQATTPAPTPTPGPTAASPPSQASPIIIESVIGVDDITLVVSTPVARGQTARATVKTNPHAECSITLGYPSEQRPAELTAKDADGGGFVSWSWTIEPSTPSGSWPVDVTCLTVSGLRAIARQTLVVT